MESMTAALHAMLAPRRVAIVGAAQDPLKVRGRLLYNLQLSGFQGDVLPIHPKHAEVQGVRAYPRIADAGPGVDLAIIAVPSESLAGVLGECADAGVKGAVVISGVPGGGAGRQLQSEVTRIARESTLRVLGPNCLGFFRPFGRVAATFSPLSASQFNSGKPGGKRVSIISQSGGTGLQIFEMCHAAGLNVVQVMMPGNEADIDVVELLEYAVDSGEVDVVLMYIEGINDGPRFMRAAANAADAHIPVVALKIGRTQAASRAAISHTAHLTGSDAAYDAMFHQYGITRVNDPDSMVAIASVMAGGLRMRGDRVGIVASGGGHATMWTDLCGVAGLSVPSFTPQLRERLDEFIPSHGSSDNPVDTAGISDDQGLNFCRAIETLMASDEVDAILASCHLGLTLETMHPYLERFAAANRKPLVLARGTAVPPENKSVLDGIGIPLLPFAAAAHALKALAEHGNACARREGVAQDGRPAPAPPAGADVHSRAGQLALLRHYGALLPQERLARSTAEACAAARDIGFPVVLKIESPDVPHKTEAGGVMLGLKDEAAVREAYRAILDNVGTRAPQARIDGVLVQEMAAPGRELIVGVAPDDTFGPQLMVGLGGIHAEVLNDVVLSPLPVDRRTALDMLSRLRGARILAGVRGEAPADLDSVADLLAGVSRLAMNHPGIEQLDLNPVIVYPQGRGHRVVDSLFVTKVHA